jgi:hypothetical protein
MGPSSSDQVERQDNAPSATMLPQSEQAPPQTRPRDSEFAAGKYCSHVTPRSLLARLPSSLQCPRCDFRDLISKTRAAQQELTERGGAFASKEIGTGHHNVKQDWRILKMQLANTVARFEALLADPWVQVRDRAILTSLLDVWDTEKDGLAKVPGMREVPTEEEPSEEEHEVARLMIELFKLVLEKEMTAKDKAHIRYNEAKQLLDRLGQQHNQAAAPQSSPATTSDPATPKWESSCALNHIALPSPSKSILKRKSISPLAHSPRTPKPKRTRITDTVTISPQHINISNPSSFAKLSIAPTVQPHAEHTEAEKKRRKTIYYRRRRAYKPGVWASGAGEEKVNTSYCYWTWEEAEEIRCREIKEEEQQRKAVEGLKVIAGAWVGLWWIRRDVGCVGLDWLQTV